LANKWETSGEGRVSQGKKSILLLC